MQISVAPNSNAPNNDSNTRQSRAPDSTTNSDTQNSRAYRIFQKIRTGKFIPITCLHVKTTHYSIYFNDMMLKSSINGNKAKFHIAAFAMKSLGVISTGTLLLSQPIFFLRLYYRKIAFMGMVWGASIVIRTIIGRRSNIFVQAIKLASVILVSRDYIFSKSMRTKAQMAWEKGHFIADNRAAVDKTMIASLFVSSIGVYAYVALNILKMILDSIDKAFLHNRYHPNRPKLSLLGVIKVAAGGYLFLFSCIISARAGFARPSFNPAAREMPNDIRDLRNQLVTKLFCFRILHCIRADYLFNDPNIAGSNQITRDYLMKKKDDIAVRAQEELKSCMQYNENGSFRDKADYLDISKNVLKAVESTIKDTANIYEAIEKSSKDVLKARHSFAKHNIIVPARQPRTR